MDFFYIKNVYDFSWVEEGIIIINYYDVYKCSFFLKILWEKLQKV